MATIPRYPKVSTQNLIRSSGADFGVPSPLNQAIGRRLIEQEQADAKQADMKLSPLDKAVSALKATASMGSMMFQAIQQAPKALQGQDAYTEAIGNRAYIPEDPKALEYMGDFGNMLERLETEYKIPNLMPELMPFQTLGGLAKVQANQAVEQGATRAGMAAERALDKPVTDIMNRGGRGAGLLGSFSTNPAQVVKPKGGNWEAGAVERALRPMKRNETAAKSLEEMRSVYPPEVLETMSPETRETVTQAFPHLEKEVALNNWVDRNLTNYVKKEMGTPEDPVRRLAEEGISHIPAEDLRNEANWLPERLEDIRRKQGFPGAGMANSPEAQGWEIKTDTAIDPSDVGTMRNLSHLFKKDITEPWMANAPDETKVYMANDDLHGGYLGFDHIMDVLRQDVASGRIRPDQLSKVSMEQAVRRTYEFDQEMARKMVEAQIKATEGMPVHKDYGDEGYKWIELTAPKDNPKRLSEIDTLLNANRQGGEYGVDWLRGANGEKEYFVTKGSGRNTVYMDKFPTEEEAIARGKELSGQRIDVDALRLEREGLTKEAREKILEDALKYEGDTMGHCVGGYCPDVVSGKSRIYSLRDKKGEPHVTVEVNPIATQKAIGNLPRPEREALAKSVKDQYFGGVMPGASSEDKYWELLDKAYIDKYGEPQPSIRQIKGKQNAAPKEDYLPYVQDFVRSGEWSDVGDFKNTGLMRAEDVKKAGWDMGDIDQKYLTKQEYDDLLLKQLGNPPPEGMKAGGQVGFTDNPDSMMMELEDQKFAGGGAIIKRVLAIGDHTERALAAQKLLATMENLGPVAAEEKRALLKAQSGARSLPTVLPRAYPKTKEQIRGYAQRTADQLNAAQQGQFLREDPTGASVNAAGKSKKQWEMEQDLTHDLKPLGKPLDQIKTANIEDQLGMLKMGITGDTSVSDQMLHRAGQYALQSPSEQQGGPLYGLRKRFDPAAWASNVPVLENVQRDIGEFSRAYGDVPVIGQYNSMGPQGTNFAQHFADANLEAIDITKMTPDQIEQANKLIKMGNEKSGAFPDFPGIQDPGGAYFYFSFFPELRKHFNNIMTKPDFTSKLGLPDGRVILHAITDPELRDMPVLTSGRAQYQLVPDQDPKKLPLSEHSTYTHNLPRDPDAPVTQTPFPVPAEFEFSDVAEYAQPRYKPSEMTRVLQTAAPRQIIDQQHIDEIKQYEDFMRQYSPQSEKKKDGGLIKVKRKAGGGIISKVAKEALERMKPAKAEMAARGALWDKKMAEDSSKYLRDVQPFNPTAEDIQDKIQSMQDVKKAIGGAINADDLILTERPL